MPKNDDGNGFIPVKYESCEVLYDVNKGDFIATVKVGTKKIAFQQVKD